MYICKWENSATYCVISLCLCVIIPQYDVTHTHTQKSTKLQSPLMFLLCPRSLSIYLSISVKYTGFVWCALKQSRKVTVCLKAVSHYKICSHVKHTQRYKAVISDILLLTIHVQKAVYFHIDGALDRLLLLLSLSRNACWYFSDV